MSRVPSLGGSGSGTLSRRALLALGLLAPAARSLGRTPYGGVLRLTLPFAVDSLDPHREGDAVSAFLSAAIADPLFAWDRAGNAYPALAAGMPELVRGGCRVTLRAGLKTGTGRALDARDVVASLDRSRRKAGRPLLAPFGVPVRDPGGPLGVVFPSGTPEALAAALASPVTAIVSRAALERDLDGTGAFRATSVASGLILERNEQAARGPAFLDRVEIRRAADLSDTLRAFEVGEADVGFLGAGLHRRRPGAVDFRTPPAGFVVLRSGPEAKTWGAPGVTTELVHSMAPGVLSHLGLVTAHGTAGDAGWGGPPADVLVDEGAPFLVEVARVVAAVLTRPGHALTAAPMPASEVRSRRATGRFSLTIEFVRRVGPSPRHAVLSLLHAADPRLAERPPRVTPPDLASLTRTLSLAVLGEVSVAGAHAPEFQALPAWDLGAVYRSS